MENLDEKAQELLIGGYDLHVHAGPSVFPRALDCFELVKEADEAHMAGIMLKSHYESTAFRALLVNKYGNCKVKAYGGIALNWPAGGLNVHAVQNALQAGARIVWMPTRDSEHSLSFGNMLGDFFSRKGITLLTAEGRLKDCVYDIMDVVKQYDGVLATGHISLEESILLCTEGRRRGVRMILTHPEFSRTSIPGSMQKEMADKGVIIEKTLYSLDNKTVTIEEMAENIRMVGTNRTFIATDRGQQGMPHPVAELRQFIVELLKLGFTDVEIEDLVKNVPRSIVEH